MAIEKSRDPEQFSAFEQVGWDTAICAYERAFGPVSRQTVKPLLDAAKVGPGMLVLDVCTGPGMLVGAAIERGARATGLDFAKEVVELAQRRVPAGDFRQGDAQNLPFRDASFDAVVCAYGVIHVPVPEMALSEMVRVVCFAPRKPDIPDCSPSRRSLFAWTKQKRRARMPPSSFQIAI